MTCVHRNGTSVQSSSSLGGGLDRNVKFLYATYLRKIQKRLLLLIPCAHSGPGNETTVKNATLLDSPRANSPVRDVAKV